MYLKSCINFRSSHKTSNLCPRNAQDCRRSVRTVHLQHLLPTTANTPVEQTGPSLAYPWQRPVCQHRQLAQQQPNGLQRTAETSTETNSYERALAIHLLTSKHYSSLVLPLKQRKKRKTQKTSPKIKSNWNYIHLPVYIAKTFQCSWESYVWEQRRINVLNDSFIYISNSQ